MFRTDGETLVTMFLLTAAIGAAAWGRLAPSVSSSRKTVVVASLLGAMLVAITASLVLVFWDFDTSWFARIALGLCALTSLLIVANFVALYQDHGHLMRRKAPEKLKVI